ncbi:MAG TPA: SMC family ATPase [Streptosporangiaceae bacterium]
MRPLRLLLDGFGSYRQPASVDFSDVEFFALTGPTGSGKSTLIDGLCFALYGTVPRWGSQNAIAQALAPAANACRVCLVFELAGRRYAAVRALSRDARGQVHTREARLERLDSAVPATAPVEELLQASAEQLAEGPDQVKAVVQELLGLSYEHFTQSVLLPQGRFAEFLQAKASARQDLLVELLAFGVYEQVGRRARDRARLAAERAEHARAARADLAGATAEAEREAAGQLAALSAAADTAEQALAGLDLLRQQAGQADKLAAANRDEHRLLTALRVPAEVSELASLIADAEQRVAAGRELIDGALAAEQAAASALADLPDRALTEQVVTAHAQRSRLTAGQREQQRQLTARQQAERERAAELQQAERGLRSARDGLASAERADAAAHLAGGLRAGAECPVCGQLVASLPAHLPPAGLVRAREAAGRAEAALQRAQAAHRAAAAGADAARGAAEQAGRQIADLDDALAGAPAADTAAGSLAAINAAARALEEARRQTAGRRAQAAAAERDRAALGGAEQKARAMLTRSRDALVALGAPAVDDGGLAAGWRSLASWSGGQAAERAERQAELDTAAAASRAQVADAAGAVLALLAGLGIDDVTEPARATTALAERRARVEARLDTIRRDRRQSDRLARAASAAREEEQVATELGLLLRSSSFERWLCSEALDSLVAEASATLLELSGGQYQLDRDDRNELVVIDFEDAGARRPVHTLSGGETFQASLALALALSRQVVGLSAGQRDLNSMFLDEGFGTLDADSLETVAATLERLAASSDRMVGIVTHVPALAERVPVRFVVSRTGQGSTLRRDGR